jgi:hypothetical protein
MTYKLADFRKCTRQAFNEAEEGKEVIIERYGKQYQLTVRGVETFTVQNIGDAPMKPVSSGTFKPKVRMEPECSRHHVPANLCRSKH